MFLSHVRIKVKFNMGKRFFFPVENITSKESKWNELSHIGIIQDHIWNERMAGWLGLHVAGCDVIGHACPSIGAKLICHWTKGFMEPTRHL
jgi:hypothetical protein